MSLDCYEHLLGRVTLWIEAQARLDRCFHGLSSSRTVLWFVVTLVLSSHKIVGAVTQEGDSMDVQVIVRSGLKTQTIVSRRGLGFQAICAKHQIDIEYDCRKSDCGICAIKILNGQENLSAKTNVEADFLNAMRADQDERLACQTRILGNVEILVNYL